MVSTFRRLAALLLLGLFLVAGAGCGGSGPNKGTSTVPQKDHVPVSNDPLHAGKGQAGANSQ
jgi:hypothetical protein